MIYVLNHVINELLSSLVAVVEGPDGFDMQQDIETWVNGICKPRPVVTEHQGLNTPGYRKQKKKLDEWLAMKREHCSLPTYLERLKELGFKILKFEEVDACLLEI